jgi:hypothetical protein
MLRITQSISTPVTTIYLQGKFLAPWVDEFEAAIATAPGAGPVRVDLADLSFADAGGIAALKAARSRGIALDHATPFVASLLSLL